VWVAAIVDAPKVIPDDSSRPDCQTEGRRIVIVVAVAGFVNAQKSAWLPRSSTRFFVVAVVEGKGVRRPGSQPVESVATEAPEVRTSIGLHYYRELHYSHPGRSSHSGAGIGAVVRDWSVSVADRAREQGKGSLHSSC
jgi:hypothetical protein